MPGQTTETVSASAPVSTSIAAGRHRRGILVATLGFIPESASIRVHLRFEFTTSSGKKCISP